MTTGGTEGANFSTRTVFLQEAVDALVTDPEGVYVDGTFGRGGHSRLLLERLGERARLLVIDKDPEAIAAAEHCARRIREWWWDMAVSPSWNASSQCFQM